MRFFLIIGKDNLYVYEKNGGQYERQFIQGRSFYPYDMARIDAALSQFLDELADEKNLGSREKLGFDVLENEDAIRTGGVMRALGDAVEKRLPLPETIKKVMKRLSKDKALFIDEYGINYDGVCYKTHGQALLSGPFDLLAYTIHEDDMVEQLYGEEGGEILHKKERGAQAAQGDARGAERDAKEAAFPPEDRMKRIARNLSENPHYPILWNETVDAYTRKVERIQSLLRLADTGIGSGELGQKIDDFLALCRKPDFQIAFVGTIKTGKSTLINALLGHNYASMDVTPETAALTKFRSSEKDYIHVVFYSKKEWSKLWKTVQKGADKFLETYYELGADKEKDRWLGHREEHREVENRDIEKELARYSSSKSAVHYFVKEIEVGISTLPKDFPRQVVFVDTPGLSDPVEYRSQISRDYIHKANAVFVCVDAAKIYKEEIETIASVFSFSSHNKNKVHIIATHWDTLNDPVEDWKKQGRHMAEQLTGPAFYASREIASKKIMYSAAYIYNLCRDYPYLERKEKRALHILPMKLDMDVEPGTLGSQDLERIMEICNIRNISQVIVDELVKNYSKLLYGDVERLYHDIKYIVRRASMERKKELQERIAMSDKDIHQLEKKVLEKKKDNDTIRQTQEQLRAALDSLERNTKKRLDSIMSQLK